ncbi:hypothetical protein FHS96_000351 [Sphingomonas zeicaulis]|uniref:hypothetical protein n=1 Tax=Sphingomonas zeicaulis TaxID=1632740 RepID=UPI003D23ACA2
MPSLTPDPHRPSRQRGPTAPALLAAGLAIIALPAAAQAQPADGSTAAAMIETAKQFYHVRQMPLDCDDDADPMMPDAIIVCGRARPGPRLTTSAPPAGPDPMRITLSAPPPGGGVGAGVTIRMCFLQACPKPVHLIDLAAIPVAAPGSDADRIAKGETRDR